MAHASPSTITARSSTAHLQSPQSAPFSRGPVLSTTGCQSQSHHKVGCRPLTTNNCATATKNPITSRTNPSSIMRRRLLTQGYAPPGDVL